MTRDRTAPPRRPVPGRRRAGSLAAVLLALAAIPSAAQEGSPVPTSPLPVSLGGPDAFLTPHLGWTAGPLSVDLEGTVGLGGPGYRDGRVRASVPLAGGLRVAAGVAATARAAGEHGADDALLRVGVHGRRAGVWFGRAVGSASIGDHERDVRGVSARAWLDAGVGLGLTVRSDDLEERGETVRDTLYRVLDWDFRSTRTVAYLRSRRSTDVEADVSVPVGPGTLTLVAGRRLADVEELAASWAYGRVALPLSRRLELVGEAGRNGGIHAVGRRPSGFARVGVRIDVSSRPDGPELPPAAGRPAPAARAPRSGGALRARVEVAAPGEADGPVLLVTAPGAVSVEVRGDFTEWRAVPMHAGDAGIFRHPLGPGVHRLDVRVDGGEWTVPAGLPTVPDEFTGALVAVVVVD